MGTETPTTPTIPTPRPRITTAPKTCNCPCDEDMDTEAKDFKFEVNGKPEPKAKDVLASEKGCWKAKKGDKLIITTALKGNIITDESSSGNFDIKRTLKKVTEDDKDEMDELHKHDLADFCFDKDN